MPIGGLTVLETVQNLGANKAGQSSRSLIIPLSLYWLRVFCFAD
jgi:hypothetical protein